MSAATYLRQAAIEALKQGDDTAAHTLVALLSDRKKSKAPSVPTEVLEDDQEENPAHNRSFWIRLLAERYIPSLAQIGVMHFTNFEFQNWVLAHEAIELNDNDYGLTDSGHVRWRRRISLALKHMRETGSLSGKPRGQMYEYDLVKLQSLVLEIPANYPLPD